MIVGELGGVLVARVLLLDAADDVGGHAERLVVRVAVDRGEQRVLSHGGRRLRQVEGDGLVVTRVRLGTGQVVALVDHVSLGGRDVGAAGAVGAQIGTLPLLVAPEGALDVAVALRPDQPEVEVDRVLARGGIPADTGGEDLTLVGRECLGVALGERDLLRLE